MMTLGVVLAALSEVKVSVIKTRFLQIVSIEMVSVLGRVWMQLSC